MTMPSFAVQSTAAFDADPTFEPGAGPGTVEFTGSATNAAGIADIEFYDGTTDLGGTGQISGSSWSFAQKFSAGRHDVTAVVTDLDGSSYTIAAPYAFITGVRGEPYVYQELDETVSGAIDRVANYDASGNLVSQTSVAVAGSSAAPFHVSFDPTTTFVGATESLITGTTSAYGAAASIEIFDGTAKETVDPKTGALLPGAEALGYAYAAGDGSWSFDAHVSPGKHVFTAVATSVSGQTAVSQSSFTIETGITGAPFVYEEFDHDAKGAVSATISYAADGSVVGRHSLDGLNVEGGAATGNVYRSSYDDVMTSDGLGSTTFYFTSGFDQDEITNFRTGVSHDVISLPRSDFANLAQLFGHIGRAHDGSAIIHLDPHDSIKIDGVTRKELAQNVGVFRFHT